MVRRCDDVVAGRDPAQGPGNLHSSKIGPGVGVQAGRILRTQDATPQRQETGMHTDIALGPHSARSSLKNYFQHRRFSPSTVPSLTPSCLQQTTACMAERHKILPASSVHRATHDTAMTGERSSDNLVQSEVSRCIEGLGRRARGWWTRRQDCSGPSSVAARRRVLSRFHRRRAD